MTPDIEKAQPGGRVGALHLVAIGHRTLQSDRARSRKNRNQNDDQIDAGPEGTECLPDFAGRGAQ
jgi:hypothetical protein